MIVAFTHSSTSVPGFASWTSQASFSYTATARGEYPQQAEVCEYATSRGSPKVSVTAGYRGMSGTMEAVGHSRWSQTRGQGGAEDSYGYGWTSNSGTFMYSETGNGTVMEVIDTCSLVPIIPGVGRVCQPCGHFSQRIDLNYNRYTWCPNAAPLTRIGLNGGMYYTYLYDYCAPTSCGSIPYGTGYLNRAFSSTQSAEIPDWIFKTNPVDAAITLQDSHTLRQVYGKDVWFSRMGGPAVVEAPWAIAGSVNISDTNRVEAATTLTTTYTGFVSALTANRTTQNNSNIPDFGATGLDVAIGTLSSAVSTITRTVGIPESRTFEYKTKAYQGVSFTTPPVVDENLDGFPDYQNPCTNFVISGGTGWAYDNTNFHVPLAGYSGIHNRMGRKKEDVYVGSYHVSTSSGNFLSQPPAWTTGSILAPLLITSTQNQPGNFSMPSVVTDPIGFAVGPFITVSGLSGWYTIDSPPTVFGTITTGQPQTITTANFDGTGTAETIITKFSTSSTTVGTTRVPAQIVSFPGTGGWPSVSANALGAAWQTVATIDVSLAGNEPCQYPAFFSRQLSILTTRASGWSLSQTRTASGETLNWPYTLSSAFSGASSTRGATAGFLGETYFGIPKFVGNNSNYALSVTRPFIVSQSEIVKAITYETFIDTGLLPQNWSLSISSRSSVSSLASLGHHTSSDWLGNPGPMVNLKARWGQTAYSANDNVASITNNIYARDSMLTTSEFPRASEFISASLVNSACPSAGIFVLRTSIERVAETDFIYREWIGHASAPAYMTIQGGIPPSGGSATPSSFLTDYKCGQLTLVACIRATGQEETFTNIRHGAMSSPPPFGTFLLHNALGVSSDGNLSSGTFKVSEWQNVFTNNWYATSQARAYPDANDFSQGMFWLDQTGGAAGMCAIVVSRSAAVPLVHSRLDMIYHPVAPVFHNFAYWNNSAYTPVIFADQGGTADGIYPNERMIGPNAWQPERKFGAVGIEVEPLPEPPGGGGGGGGDGGGGGGGGGDGGGGGGGGGGGSYEE